MSAGQKALRTTVLCRAPRFLNGQLEAQKALITDHKLQSNEHFS